MAEKSIMHDTVRVGDEIVCAGQVVQVNEIIVHAPGRENARKIPVHNDWWAIEYKTGIGSRWRGFKNGPEHWLA